MKKFVLLLITAAAILFVSACDSNNNTVTPPANTKGNLFISSTPAGAQIWLDGVNTSQVTPDTVLDIEEGSHNFTLKLSDYSDTTIAISITADQTGVLGPVVLTSNILTTLFGPVTIYETNHTSASQPSGLDLSTGNPWGVSSDSSGLVDIYYSTTGTGGEGYLIQSADLNGLVRVTKFFVGSGDNIFDDVDSPDRFSGTWTNNMDDRETNYVFLYDQDGHYSKIKIVGFGGAGTIGDPAWVKLQWYYNEVALDKRF
jgi:PEGA domain